MTTRRTLLAAAASLAWCGPALAVDQPPLTLSDAQWRRRLTPAQFAILRRADTEMPFSSPLDAQFAAGRYDCIGCARPLFSSHAKFDSHTGWPSFYEPLRDAVARSSDGSFGMQRTEVHCARCGGHLGHVFDDGPRPTGLRYCMNGAVLNFVAGAAA